MDFLTLGDSHSCNTRNRDDLRLRRVTQNWVSRERLTTQLPTGAVLIKILETTNIKLFKRKMLNVLHNS